MLLGRPTLAAVWFGELDVLGLLGCFGCGCCISCNSEKYLRAVFLCCTENTTFYGAGEQIHPNHTQRALFYYYPELHLKSSFLLLSWIEERWEESVSPLHVSFPSHKKKKTAPRLILPFNTQIQKCSSGSLSNASKFSKERTDQPSPPFTGIKGPQGASGSPYTPVKAKREIFSILALIHRFH